MYAGMPVRCLPHFSSTVFSCEIRTWLAASIPRSAINFWKMLRVIHGTKLPWAPCAAAPRWFEFELYY